MGQTLTHGIYLPDEGERNCYNGLAGNWQLLDGAVGTIAEHTTQIAGKAPAEHTHTKSDITDFPAYGNTAGTICEGNDSRLSDARTPVAHTHTKSDVTDLLNSNFIPSANNTHDLGSSSYQWNNVYSKNYFYNGTPWGLDKANVWTNTNTFQQNITYERTNFFHQASNPCYFLKDTVLEKGSLTSATHSAYAGNWQDKNNANLGYMRFVAYDTGKQTVEFRIGNLIKNGALDPTGSVVNCTAFLELQPSGEKSFSPEQNNDINLGTSTNKWKTLNGINPGALSLPDLSDPDPIYTNNWVGDNSSSNQYTPTENGWIYFRIEGANKNITIRYGGAGGDSPSITSESALTHLSVFFPVRSGVTMYIFFNGTMVKAFFYPCLGNV